MAWTSPRTWVAGEKPPASTMNTHIRDNLNALYSSWADYTPTWGSVTLGTTGLVNTARYTQTGKLVHVRICLTLGTGGALTAAPTLSLPVAANMSDDTGMGVVTYLDASAALRRNGTIRISGSTARFDYENATPASSSISATLPFTWAVGDTIAGLFTYEAA